MSSFLSQRLTSSAYSFWCRGLFFQLITNNDTEPVGRTPLDLGSARRGYLYVITHNIHTGQTAMPSAGFESAVPKSERPQTHALDRAATGIDEIRN